MVRITGFIWLERFVEKLEAKHAVAVEEVEELFRNRAGLAMKKVSRGRYRDEHVYRALGRTWSGRHLAVFFILKSTGEALVISARDMDGKERRSYASQRPS